MENGLGVCRLILTHEFGGKNCEKLADFSTFATM
jgi:hypothetical protein